MNTQQDKVNKKYDTIHNPYSFDEVWYYMVEYGIATDDELRLVCHINGKKIETLNDVIEVRTTYKDWSHYLSMNYNEFGEMIG